MAGNLRSQTTLSGDHIVEGDLDVGTSTTKGNLTVVGETGSIAAPGIKVSGDGGVLFEGTFGTGQIPAIGAGTRFMWYPKKAALRVGYLYSGNSDYWDDSNIGNYSMAFGEDTRASGAASTATGTGTSASGHASTSMGAGTSASSYASTAMGTGTSASGYASTAMGWATLASGTLSTAMGTGTSASGYASTSMGSQTFADASYSVAIGRYNIGGGHPTQWNAGDPLFEIGNGTGIVNDPNRYRNAFIVYKNGDVEITKRQGDILMGEFGNPGE